MGQKLRPLFLTIILLFTTILIGGSVTASYGQISLQNDTPLEVRFSQGASEKNDNRVTIGLSEIESILSPEFSIKNDQWQEFYSSKNDNVNFFVSGGIYGTAPGRIQLENSVEQTFFAISVQNDSDYRFGNFLVAFDFIYNYYESGNAHSLKLQYKVNDGKWSSLPSGVINESSFRSTEDTWSSFSLHLNINEIYLRPSDTIHLMWIIESQESISERMPLALQRIEISPETIEQNMLSRGDLIITEILPVSEVNGDEFEYVEIYNPGERTISLKGVELVTENGSKVIQQDVFVEPNSFTVISNVDISSLDGVGNSYFYNDPIIKSNTGRVELVRAGELIASANYEPTEPGVAVELTRISQAYDGYSSMQDFISAQTTYFQNLAGSPGVNGSSIPFFKKTIEQPGVYLLSFPGVPIDRLNRNLSVNFYDLDGSPLDLSSISPHTPILLEKEESAPVTLFAESESNQSILSTVSTQFTRNSAFLTIPYISDSSEKAKAFRRSIFQSFPITQTWNPQNKKFNLIFTDQAVNDYWSPILVNESVSLQLSGSDNQAQSPVPDRNIEFGILPENQENSSLSDVVMVGFFDPPSQYEDLRYDLPKLVLNQQLNSEQNEVETQQLYLTSVLSEESFNIFTHLPQNLDQAYELGLGYKMSNNAGGAVLRWKISNKIPEEWVIELEDTYSGTVVNLREESEYRFRYTNSDQIDTASRDEIIQLTSINPEERPRFLLNVKPFESFTTSKEEEEVPNSIELRPNYPNPFNPSTNINFYLPEERNVRVGVYNIVGQQVALLLEDVVQQGEHSLLWDAADRPSGIYIVQLETGNRIFTRKITLIK